ncbi:uncharacterized protein pkdc [Aplochiton taeniatus]
MKKEYQELVLEATGASSIQIGAPLQDLWGGYGKIIRVYLEGCDDGRPSVVVKHVKFPSKADQGQSGSPSRWNTEKSHQRKVRSYQVESHWYQKYSTSKACQTPMCLATHSYKDETLMILEDLDVTGFDQRRTSVNDVEIRACLSWLAHFHGLFLGVAPEGLWTVGTYWHLATRLDELEAMEYGELKTMAGEIDRILNECRFKTIVHGDAKLANFCFSKSGQEVAGVDFQYVGGGCGMKDVIYFLGSCIKNDQCERRIPSLLSYYFTELRVAVSKEVDFDALEAEWQSMFAFAWTDFDRFLLGWNPEHWKISRYSNKLTKKVLAKLKN